MVDSILVIGFDCCNIVNVEVKQQLDFVSEIVSKWWKSRP